MTKKSNISRRKFIGSTAAASLGFTLIPRQVLGGPGYVAPSDKLNIGYIGCGTQGIREMASLITNPNIRIVAVCDPNKYSTNYVDWSPFDIRNNMRKATGDNKWGENINGIPGGRDVGLELVNKYYGRQNNTGTYNGCNAYEDFRELLEKENGIDAIKIMTPDHLHAPVALASMKKGRQVVTHKPIANRMHEAKVTIDTARKTGIGTHLLAWSRKPEYDLIKKWLDEGRIGKLKEIHNWSNRPMWPQWQANPKDTPAIPEGMNWQLWLGPVPDRPYHPYYTNAVFRGWYDFGAGSIADMGHYSLFPLFTRLGITSPALSAEAYATTTCALNGNVSVGVKNDVAFPLSCIVRFKFGKQPSLEPFELFWYDGGMKPMNFPELEAEGKALSREGMLFVGEKGRILAGFQGENPVIYSEGKTFTEKPAAETDSEERTVTWIDSFLAKKESPGSFIYAGPVTETILLGGVALRAGRKVEYDSALVKITNYSDANKFLVREYRPGWEI